MKMEPLLESERLFVKAFNSAPIGMALVSLNGNVLKMNKAGLAFLGYTKEEVTCLYFREITHPDDLELNLKYRTELLAGKRESYQMTKRYLHKSGHYVWAYLSVSLAKDLNGNPSYIISQFIDLVGQKKAEQKLQESLSENQLITENSLDMITKIAPDGKYFFVSPACTELTGYSPEDLLGVYARNFYHPDERDLIRDYHNNIIKVKGKGTITHRYRCKNGEYIWFETSGIHIPSQNGRSLGTLTFSRDVTQRKLDENLLKENEQRYKSLFDNHPDMVFSLTLSGELKSINQSYEKITGYTTEVITTHPYTFHSVIHPDDVRKVIRHFERAKKGKVQRFEATMRIKSGEYICLDVTNVPIMIDGSVVGVYGIAQNISDRKAAERRLKATSDQLASFISNHVDPITLFNTNNELTKINHAFTQTFGWTSDDLMGLKVTDMPFIPENDKVKLIHRVEAMNQQQVFSQFEAVRTKKDGTPLDMIISNFPIEAGDQQFVGWATTFRDITDQKKAEAMMINSEKLTIAGQLAAGIAHEIRNPLTAIKGFLQFMEMSKEAPPNPSYFNIIGSEIERIEGILSELLILAKPQKVHFKKTNVRTLLYDVIKLLESQAILNDVVIRIEEVEGEYDINCEPNQLKQVFINFIQNAIEAMTQGGQLIIRLENELEKGGVRLQFIDEGEGIPLGVIEKLGQPFYTTKEKGTGLGFMVSKKIIEDHFGEIKVESELNKGTTMDVFLPFDHNNK
jgi:two-component system sporulation sensor kinase A